MGLFRSKKDVQLMETAQGLDEREPNRSNHLEKKRAAILRDYEEPVLPRFCKILFISMLIITALAVLAEISGFLQRPGELGMDRFLHNLTTTALVIWAVYTALLTVFCAIGMWIRVNDFRRRQSDSGLTDQTPEDSARSRRAIRRLNAAYLLYLKICLIGLIICLICFFAVRLLL